MGTTIKMSKYFIPYLFISLSFLKYVHCHKEPYGFCILLPDKFVNNTLEICILNTGKIVQLVSRLFESLNKYGFHYLHLLPYYPLKQLVSFFLYYVYLSSQFVNFLMIHKINNEHNFWYFCRYTFYVCLVWVNENDIVCYDLLIISSFTVTCKASTSEQRGFIFFFFFLFSNVFSKLMFLTSVFFVVFENFCCLPLYRSICHSEIKCFASFLSSETLSFKIGWNSLKIFSYFSTCQDGM